jgi:hypothetical protein
MQGYQMTGLFIELKNKQRKGTGKACSPEGSSGSRRREKAE